MRYRIINYLALIFYLKVKNNKNHHVLKKIKNLKKRNDMIICCDYGHNFITNEIVKEICKFKKGLYVNAQINSANFCTVHYQGTEMLIQL